MMPTTPETELRTMIGDLFMQVAMIRAELNNLKEQQPQPLPAEPEAKPNGKSKQHPEMSG
jgi:hypothetical protein